MSDEKVDAWMPLWIGAYLADTMTLTTQQHGAYLLLLFAYWRNRGPLVDDDEDLASIVKASPAEWRKLRVKLARFFTIEGGLWSHGRADKELANAGMRKSAAVSKAKAAADARWEKSRKECSKHAPSIAQALLKQCPTPSPLPTPGAQGGGEPQSPARAESEIFDPEGQDPTPAGLAWRAVRAAGIADGDPGHPGLHRLLAGGVTAEDLAATAAELVRQGKGRFGLLLATVEGRRVDAAAAGKLPAAPAADPWETRASVDTIARGLGLQPWDECCHWPEFVAKVRAAADAQGVAA